MVEQVVADARTRVGDGEVPIEAFVRRWLEDVSLADLQARDRRDLSGAAVGHWRLGRRRMPGTPVLRLANPDIERLGWHTPHTVLDLVTDDMPFLVDSVSLALATYGYGTHLVIHPLFAVERDAQGRLVALGDGPPNESWIHLELDRVSGPDRQARLEQHLRTVLAQVRAAVEDWPAMTARAADLAEALPGSPAATIDPVGAAEAADLLRWLADGNFTFLGARRYEIAASDDDAGIDTTAEPGDGDVLQPVAGTGLGILRDDLRPPVARPLRLLPAGVREHVRRPQVLVVTRTNARSTVHRGDRLAYIGVKRIDDQGRVVGEDRFVGLHTARTYRGSARDVPFLRRKIDTVLKRAEFPIDSHSGRELWNILETYPRDELFQIPVDELYETALGILSLQERRQVKLFVRRDDLGRFVSALVYVPRDRYSAAVVERIGEILGAAYGAASVEHETLFTESVLARVFVLLRLGPDAPTDVDATAVEHEVAAAARWWLDDLRDVLVDTEGEDRGLDLLARYADAFPAAYREAYRPHAARHDIGELERLPGDAIATALLPSANASQRDWRFKLYTHEAVSISRVLPLLEHLGVEVVDERPFAVKANERPPAWVYDIGLRAPEHSHLDAAGVGDEFRSLFVEVWLGRADDDDLNRLVLVAGLGRHDIAVLRAYARYLRQVGLPFDSSYVEGALVRQPAAAQLLARLFRVRFDPAWPEGSRADKERAVMAAVLDELERVESLDDDRILRSFLHLVEATVRTNAFRAAHGSSPVAPVLSFKLDPSQVLDLPLPRPAHEIWVSSPRVEGVHLRGGDVARGGIRWSDRREDFRTEVLGLMKAQMVKNAVIVPVGAKGGFVVRRPPRDPEALRAEVASCYRAFIGGLLDVTDNLVGATVVPPAGVVRHDVDDPYLVVAADKGTATFSDLANEVAAEYGFWLGDAFASGGRTGYDHKAMGITARGAWESVRRHCRVLGLDADTAELTVVGIGDLSGDVFGNGLLLSPHLRLVAAFDHRHVFLDPDPDPARSFAERRRLFELPRSSWDDYDRSAISPGGGVWSRRAKSVPLSREVQRRLGIDADNLTPNEVVSAILRAPVDLLWNGGIGTFVKASTERHADVGDRANDAVRVDADQLRCRIVAEGGNLGLTQPARVEYALGGGMVNTDAIDNSAGVDTSDHEVNIKILLDRLVAAGELDGDERNELLQQMTDDVARLVLEDNRAQTLALAIARTQAAPMLNVHARYVRWLEAEGLLDRELEHLPTDRQLADRQNAGLGLTTPEFAVLLAYTKTTAIDELLRSQLPDEPYLEDELRRYFPPPLLARFGDEVLEHPLRREIIATRVANETVNLAGTSFDHRMLEETGAPLDRIVAAHVVSREIFSMRGRWAQLVELDGSVSADVQHELLLRLRQLVERGAVWLLRNRRPPLDLGATVEAFRPGVAEVAEHLPDLVRGPLGVALADRARAAIEAGVPLGLAARAAAWPLLHTAFDVVQVARARARTPRDAATAYWLLFDRLDVAWLWDRIAGLPRHDRWQGHARAALRDDLLGVLRDLLDGVLRAGDLFDAPPTLVTTWADANERAVERTASVFSEIRATAIFDLTTLSVALRQLRNVVLASRPSA